MKTTFTALALLGIAASATNPSYYEVSAKAQKLALDLMDRCDTDGDGACTLAEQTALLD